VVGDQELQAGSVTVRGRVEGDLGAMPVADFAARLLELDGKRQ
jgi:threonyl-tRNA synthetase